MQYTGLITRMISAADEAIQIIIQDQDDFSTFKSAVLEALKVTDARAAVQQHRLLEDTELTDKLTDAETRAITKAVNIVYSGNQVVDTTKLRNAKFEFAKNMASGEVLKIFMHEVDSYDNLVESLENIYAILDNRLIETNTRELEFMKFYRTLDGNTQLKVAMIMDILYGRSTLDTIKAQLEKSNENEAQQVFAGMREKL